MAHPRGLAIPSSVAIGLLTAQRRLWQVNAWNNDVLVIDKTFSAR